MNFPLPPPIFANYPPAVPPGTIPPVFPQPTGKIIFEIAVFRKFFQDASF